MSLFFLILLIYFIPNLSYYDLYTTLSVSISLFSSELYLYCSTISKNILKFIYEFKVLKHTLLTDGQSPDNHRIYRNRRVEVVEGRGRGGSSNFERGGPSNSERGRGRGRSSSPFSIRANPITTNPNQVPTRLPSLRSILPEIFPDYGRGLGDVPYNIPKDGRTAFTRITNRTIPQVYSYTEG